MQNSIPIFLGFMVLVSASAKFKNDGHKESVNDFGFDFDAEKSVTFFKSKKAVLIWKKAYNKFKFGDDTSTLKTLYGELKTIDEELMELKRMKYEDNDPYGYTENKLDEKIHALLVKYGIAGKKEGAEPRLSNRVQDHLKEDKLARLYRRAQELGFTDVELSGLKDEIVHHKLKMEEMDALVGEHDALEGRLRAASNTVDARVAKQAPAADADEKIQDLKLAIKEKTKELDASFSRLDLMSDDVGIVRDATFTQRKIVKLWADVLKSNFTQDEQDSLKEELMHLEKKMNKQNKLSEERLRLQKHHESVKSGSESRKEKYLKKHDEIKERSEQIDKHVNKYMRDLNSRISAKRHSEL